MRTKAENFRNAPKPNFDLNVISFICTNFEAFTKFSAIFTRIRRTIKCGRKPDDWEYVRSVRNETSAKINKAKDGYFFDLGKKLSDPTNGIKSYWATLNKIINKKRFSNVPPLLENRVFVTNFQTKANSFYDHFVEQCSVIINDSVLPNLVSRCDSLLLNVEITSEKILHIIRSLDPKKAHGWDDLSINMIKLCAT